MKSCSIRTNEANQVAVPLEQVTLSSPENPDGTTTLRAFNDYIEDNLDWKSSRSNHENSSSPVEFFHCGDGVLLKCKSPVHAKNPELTIFGVLENQSLYSGPTESPGAQDPEAYTMATDDKLNVILEGYKPDVDNWETVCNFNHPHFDWTRTPAPKQCDGSDQGQMQKCTANARIKFVDFSILQKSRRKSCKPNGSFVCMDNPASICHFLRSVLKCGPSVDNDNTLDSRYGVHCVSPWRDFCMPDNVESKKTANTSSATFVECDHTDQVVAILLCNHREEDKEEMDGLRKSMGDQQFWDELEEDEIREFEKFRTGDACPNFYLYSSSSLQKRFSFNALMGLNGTMFENDQINTTDNSDKNGYTMLVYRILPPRPQFTTRAKSRSEYSMENELFDSCLWEKVKSSTDEQLAISDHENVYRMTAPPYQEISDIYKGLTEHLMSDENMKIMIEEASKIPQWTAWPEKSHYKSDYDDDTEKKIDGAYPASWTVFPLCHTFPASDLSKRKFIPLTCGFVPRTTELLKESFGPVLRTALFSRLEPRTILGAHSGWSDLANHVLRVHIPISVPSGSSNEGLCGTWVDGCVETHANGRIICFDDSKTHRAFNYTEEERVVLIVDLLRPGHENKFPVGTATGGHTDELDSFINQFT